MSLSIEDCFNSFNDDLITHDEFAWALIRYRLINEENAREIYEKIEDKYLKKYMIELAETMKTNKTFYSSAGIETPDEEQVKGYMALLEIEAVIIEQALE